MLALTAAPLAAQPAGEACSPAAYYLTRGDPQRALSSLTGISGGSAENLRGLAQMLRGDLEAALEAFDAAIAIDAEAVEPRFNRSIVLLRLDRAPEAAAVLESIYDLEAASAIRGTIAYHRALAAERTGALETATGWLDRALADDPDSDDAILYSGVVLEKRGQFDAAGKRYRRYLDRHPDSILGMLRFGVVAHRSGFRDLAVRYLREVSSRAPDSPEGIEARKFLVMWE